MSAGTLLTTAEVATRLGVTRQTVINYVDAGRLVPARKNPGPTGAYLFTEAEVRKLERSLAA